MTGKFDNWNDRDIGDVIDAYPMAAIAAHDGDFHMTDMPVLLERNADGRPTALLGHLPRHAPIYPVLKKDSRCLLSFHGPSAYISPAMAGKSDWAPTWNFVVVRIAAEIAFSDELTDEALVRTVAHMEQNEQTPWTIDSLGPRYAKLRSGVIGFRARILSISARFKLGQDESDETFSHILGALKDDALVHWMKRMRDRA